MFLSDYARKPSTGKSTKNEQINNRTDFCCLRKLACIAGGFKQTVATSSNMQFQLQAKKSREDYTSRAKKPTILTKSLGYKHMIQSIIMSTSYDWKIEGI